MSNILLDRFKGMILLGAYGDALGAKYENNDTVAPPPFPKNLPPRDMLPVGFPWGTWLPASIIPRKAGVPTDDSCYRLFILHPWLNEIKNGDATFNESSLQDFLLKLRQIASEPSWLQNPRNGQIEAWTRMFQAERNGTSADFFVPERPIVFGMFMYLEMSTIYRGDSLLETFELYENQAKLDQCYAKTATAFLASMISQAIDFPPSEESFGTWFFRHAYELLELLLATRPTEPNIVTLSTLVRSMQALGTSFHGQSEDSFAVAYQKTVVDPVHPPFMKECFSGIFDPFRFLALITASIAFSMNDPVVALRIISYSSGDTQ
jgi:hypothetical protein